MTKHRLPETGITVSFVSTYDTKRIRPWGHFEWNEGTHADKWADEWLKVMKKDPSLATNRDAMIRLFDAAFSAGYQNAVDDE